jgi:hypothetical protein
MEKIDCGFTLQLDQKMQQSKMIAYFLTASVPSFPVFLGDTWFEISAFCEFYILLQVKDCGCFSRTVGQEILSCKKYMYNIACI